MPTCGSMDHPTSKLIVPIVLFDWYFYSLKGVTPMMLLSHTCTSVMEGPAVTLLDFSCFPSLGNNPTWGKCHIGVSSEPSPHLQAFPVSRTPCQLLVLSFEPQGTRTFVSLWRSHSSCSSKFRGHRPVLSLRLRGSPLPQAPPSPSLARSVLQPPHLVSGILCSPRIPFPLSQWRPTPENLAPGNILGAHSQVSYDGI